MTSPILPTLPQQVASVASLNDQRIEETAKEFEALVLAQFLAPLFNSVEAPGLTGGDGPGEDAYGALLQEQYAKAIADRGGFGIADQIKASLIDLQTVSSANNLGSE